MAAEHSSSAVLASIVGENNGSHFNMPPLNYSLTFASASVPRTLNAKCADMLEALEKVAALPIAICKFTGLRSTTPLRASAWAIFLSKTNYPCVHAACMLVRGIRQGVDLGYHGSRERIVVAANLPSADENSEAVDADIASEIEKKRRHGPFERDNAPFPNFLRANPLGVIFKKGKPKPRLVHHLSWPRRGDSVNAAIEKFTVKLDAFDRAVEMLAALGRGAYMAKIDIDSAYRCIPVRPEDWPLMALQWQGKLYFDTVMQFGLASATAIFEWYSTAAEFIARKTLLIETLTHYVDDFLLMHASKEHCAQKLDQLLKLFELLGLPVSAKKTELAAQAMVFLGILFNSITMTISLSEERVKDIEELLEEWRVKTTASRIELQSLIGVLGFASKVVPMSRIFLRRMIDQAKSIPYAAAAKAQYGLNEAFFQDVRWWREFIRAHNGKTIARNFAQRATMHMHTDACVTGYGAVTSTQWFAGSWTEEEESAARRLKRDSMPWKELHAVTRALATFAPNHAGGRIVVHADCAPVVQAWKKLDSRKTDMAALIRTLIFICATHDIELQIDFIAGVDNVLADHLSRNQIARFMELRTTQDRLPVTPLPIPTRVW